jgi:RNA polymerase sigma factor (sigma-70 family)
VGDCDDDFALLERWRNGDQQSGEALCARYFEAIYRFFDNKMASEADDLTQQTFLACVKSRDRFRGASSFRTYLYSIARNELYMRLRKIPRLEPVDLEALSLADLGTSPSQQIDKQKEIAQLHAALRQLPVEQQVLLELRYWHDLDIPELTEIFETTTGALRVRLTRARNALRDVLGAALDGDASDPLSISLRGSED